MSSIIGEWGKPEAVGRQRFPYPIAFLEDGTYSEELAVRKQHLWRIPEGIDDVHAAGLPVAYFTAQITVNGAGFQVAKTVLAPVPPAAWEKAWNTIVRCSDPATSSQLLRRPSRC
jgi:hypothetical protein